MHLLHLQSVQKLEKYFISTGIAMTITLELSDEQARWLETQAAKYGCTLKEYLLGLATRKELSYDEWRVQLRGLTKLVPENLPSLSDEVLHRETMYRA